jgi:hypothetical protein
MLESLNIHEGDFVAFAQKQNGVLINARRVVDPDDECLDGSCIA